MINKIRNIQIEYKFCLIIILVGFLCTLIFLLMKLDSLKNFDADALLYRLKLYQREEELQTKIIGKTFDISRLYMVRGENSKLSHFKVVILKNLSANNSSYIEAINFYSKLNFGKLTTIAIITTKSKGYAKAVALSLPFQVVSYMDTTLNFIQNVGIKSNDSAVLLLNERNICVYCYLLEIDNIIHNYNKAKIIEKYLSLLGFL
ncbi:hypothetical protein ABRY23_05970 [Melioribacteraceae bacterium 4301-Me]|uniref:hypothetical protein n=1 Tax=Pyranulibacter aquaticus TaxID=3163344 RepID=UPI00359A15B7